jgi:transcriptional regulator with XRE-family HTH domain
MQCPNCGHEISIHQGDGWGMELRKLRLAQGLGLRHVARIAGVSPRHLSDMELGNRGKPDPEKLEKWETYLRTGVLPEGYVEPVKAPKPPKPTPPPEPKPETFLDEAADAVEEVNRERHAG